MNLFSTSVFSILWFSIMSGSTIHFTLNRSNGGMVEAFESGIENTIYQLFENMPFTGLLVFIFLIAVFLSFVTAADSTVIAISDLDQNTLGGGNRTDYTYYDECGQRCRRTENDIQYRGASRSSFPAVCHDKCNKTYVYTPYVSG